MWLSPELKIDRTLSKIRDNDRYKLWFHGIDISEKNLKRKGMDAATFYQTEIADKIDGMGDNLIFGFRWLSRCCKKSVPLLGTILQLDVACCATQKLRCHFADSHLRTRQSVKSNLQSNKTIVFYPRSQQARCIQFMRDFATYHKTCERFGKKVFSAWSLDGATNALAGVLLQWILPCTFVKRQCLHSTTFAPNTHAGLIAEMNTSVVGARNGQDAKKNPTKLKRKHLNYF